MTLLLRMCRIRSDPGTLEFWHPRILDRIARFAANQAACPPGNGTKKQMARQFGDWSFSLEILSRIAETSHHPANLAVFLKDARPGDLDWGWMPASDPTCRLKMREKNPAGRPQFRRFPEYNNPSGG